MPDRVLLLGSVAAAVVPGALGWSHWSAEALLWTPAILAGIGARMAGTNLLSTTPERRNR